MTAAHARTGNDVVVLILTALFGCFFLAFGVYGVAMEFKTPPLHTVHLFFFGFAILFGAILMPGVGTIIFGRLKDGVGLAEPFLPRFGRRASQGEVAVASATPAAITPTVTEEHADV
jgi:hypothetical protein